MESSAQPNLVDQFYLEFYSIAAVGKLWEDIFLKLRLNERTRILDLGCGVYPKVELGLHYSQFVGEVTILDLTTAAIKKSLSFLDYLGVKFQVKTVTKSLWAIDPKPFNIITANHFLDDLVLSNRCRSAGIELKQLYTNPKILRMLWAKILANPEREFKLMDTLAERLDRLLCAGGTIILVDYFSHYYKQQKLQRALPFLKKLQSYLQASLEKKGYIRSHLFRKKELRYGWLRISSDNCLCLKKNQLKSCS